ncbi:MAG TPA: TMEM165/GDT1 family protein, partial [Steroidobacteraceae bacterium]|nr:TMEM165/GDT1 family protein [Steroidobacteraceae bacterium]
MDFAEYWKVFTMTFGVVFLAELGDKTQLATLLLASEQPGARWAVFLGSACALVLAAAIGVLAGAWIAYHVPAKTLKIV